MPDIFPFQGLRPAVGLESKVSAKSTDFSSIEEMKLFIKNNPYTYHRVTKTSLIEEMASPDEQLRIASAYLDGLKNSNILVRDQEECLYLYAQRQGIEIFSCLLALCSIADYDDDKIKRHENTQIVKEKMMSSLFEATGVLGEGVLLTHSHHENLRDIYVNISKQWPDSEFITPDGRTHSIWKISDEDHVSAIRRILKTENSFYIADGHHRSATVSRLNSIYPNGKYQRFLACLIDETQIRVSPFFRWVGQVQISGIDEILDKIGPNYKCFPTEDSVFHPEHKGEFGMYFRKAWYKLVPKFQSLQLDLPDSLDVSLLEKNILKPLFEIADPKTDHRLAYKPCDENKEEFCEKIDNGMYEIGFTLHAPEIGEIKQVSDLHLTMPPKSTYIEPKLRSGMVIYEF